MAQIQDPCKEIEQPERPDPYAPEVNPVEPQAIETPPAAFPVRQNEPIEQSTVRDSAIIEKYFWNNQVTNTSKIRYPQGALTLEGLEERPELVDSFRFVSGKNWRFQDGDLIFFNQGFEANRSRGVAFETQTRLESTSNGIETCRVRILPDLNLFENLMINSVPSFRTLPNGFGNLLFKDYVLGQSPFPEPLISDTVNWKLDFCFKSPAAFFSSEVERSSVPLVEGVSVTAHYLGEPIEQPLPGSKEIDRPSAYRFYHSIMNPVSAPTTVPNDSSQIFSNLEEMNEITEKATNTGIVDSIFGTDQGQKALNNHVRITINTKSRLERDESLAAGLTATSLHIHFMNFLVNNNIQIDSENRFVQVLDQSVLGGALNNKLVLDYEPKSYEQNASSDRSDNFLEHYGFDVAELSRQYLAGGTYEKSPIPYDRTTYDYGRLIPSAFSELENWWNTIKNRKRRTFESILEGQLAHSEIVAYRIEKSNLEGEVVQNFYFFNRYDDDVLDFIDTQIFYNSTYTYRIYAINAVIGSKYKYTTTDHAGSITRSNPYEFSVASIPVISFIETPYFEQQITMIDKPPLFPQVEVVPFFQDAQKIGFRLTPSYGSVTEKPIQITPDDEQRILTMQRNSMSIPGETSEADRPVHYSSDNPPTEYEVFILEEPPENYSDFEMGTRVSQESNYNAGYLELNLESNKRYYMIFRALDISGVSNPSAVYSLILNSHVDGVFIEFDEYEMVSLKLDEPITFEKVLKIEPSPEQTRPDFTSELERQDFYASAPSVDRLALGTEDMKVWTKDYKFRLVSRTTGKAIDLNINYAYETIQPPVPFNPEDFLFNALLDTQEEDDEVFLEISDALVFNEETVDNFIDNTSEVTNVGSEELDDSNTYTDEDGVQRSRTRTRPETVSERLEREERERRERARQERMQRDADRAAEMGSIIRTGYNYQN